MTRIQLDSGKYTVIHDNGTNFHALRHGEAWRDLTGDKLVLTMAQEIEWAREILMQVYESTGPGANEQALPDALAEVAEYIEHLPK